MLAEASLRACIEHEVRQTSANVEMHLQAQLVLFHRYMGGLQKRVFALTHETQQVRNLQVTLGQTLQTLQAPLQHQHEVGGTVTTTTKTSGNGRKKTVSSSMTPREGISNPDAVKALQQETRDVAKTSAQFQYFSCQLSETIEKLNATTAKIDNQIAWLRSAAARESECITSVPCRPTTANGKGVGRKQRIISTAAAARTPSCDTPSSVSTATSVLIARCSPGGGKLVSREAVNFHRVSDALTLSNWESEVNQSYKMAGDVVHDSTVLRLEIERQMQNMTLLCQNSRKAVLDQLATGINQKMYEKQNIVNTIYNLDQQALGVRKQWEGTSEKVSELKHPLHVAESRQKVRHGISDEVGVCLQGEKLVVVQGRRELKKLCKKMLLDLNGMHSQRRSLVERAEKVESDLRVDRQWMTLENPLSTGLAPKPPKIAGKRQFAAAHKLHL